MIFADKSDVAMGLICFGTLLLLPAGLTWEALASFKSYLMPADGEKTSPWQRSENALAINVIASILNLVLLAAFVVGTVGLISHWQEGELKPEQKEFTVFLLLVGASPISHLTGLVAIWAKLVFSRPKEK